MFWESEICQARSDGKGESVEYQPPYYCFIFCFSLTFSEQEMDKCILTLPAVVSSGGSEREKQYSENKP